MSIASELLATLRTSETGATILQKLYDIAAAVGVNVESFQPGDPTRSFFYAGSQKISLYESLVTGAINGGFLDTAEGDWLSILSASNYNTPRTDATFAECTLRLTNAGDALFTFDPDDITIKNTATGKTYRNSTGGTLAPVGTLDLVFIAEEAGSDSSSAIGEIDAIVSPSLANVSVTNTTAAVGTDGEEDSALRERARGKLASLSPNGPAAAYDYIARTSTYNGGAAVTKTRVLDDSDTGEVTVYVAGDAGAVSAGDVTLVQEAFSTYCEPLTIESTAVNASNYTQAVTYTLWVYDSINLTSAEIEDLVSEGLLAGFVARPIGGDVIPPAASGYLYKGHIEAMILRAVEPHGFRVTVATPATDVALTINQVAVLGTITPTINIVEAP